MTVAVSLTLDASTEVEANDLQNLIHRFAVDIERKCDRASELSATRSVTPYQRRISPVTRTSEASLKTSRPVVHAASSSATVCG